MPASYEERLHKLLFPIEGLVVNFERIEDILYDPDENGKKLEEAYKKQFETALRDDMKKQLSAENFAKCIALLDNPPNEDAFLARAMEKAKKREEEKAKRKAEMEKEQAEKANAAT